MAFGGGQCYICEYRFLEQERTPDAKERVVHGLGPNLLYMQP